MRHETRDKRRGLTLVEVMMAVVILSCVSVFVLQALANASYALSVAENRTDVYEFALSKMAQLEMAVLATRGLGGNEESSFQVGSQKFEWKATQQPVLENPLVGSVTLTVTWHQGSQTYESRFETLVKVPLEEKK